jgi:hypothetical protein
MSLTRIATYFGALLLAAFVVIVLAYGEYGSGAIVAVVVLALLIAGGSNLYGRRSRYGAIAARKRPAQEAHNRAADLAAEARRAAAEAAKEGERYCPLDPARDADHVASNGHASAARPAQPPPPSPR